MRHSGKLLFIKGPPVTVRLLLLVLISIALMTMDHRQQHLENIRAGIGLLVYPLQYLVSLPATAGSWAVDAVATNTTLRDENARLRERQLLLDARLQRYQALETENNRLRELLHSARKVGERVLIGELLAVDQDPFQRRIVINKGGGDGVREGQPFVDAHGVMGQILYTNPLSSVGILITDPSHAIPAQVNRNGLRVIAVGTGEADRLEIPHIPNNADIREGDLLVTSGLGQRFPPGYPVGIISEVRRDATAAYARVSARPTAHLERSREVLLVWQEGTTAAAEPEEETP